MVRALAAVLPDGRRGGRAAGSPATRPRRTRLPGRPARAGRRRPWPGRPGWSSCRSAPPRTGWSGALDLERALTEGVTGVRARPAGRRAPRRALRRRGQPAATTTSSTCCSTPPRWAVHVEREGVSVAHAARFLLVGTMNPEEGELRPQLLDRFGLTVEVARPARPGRCGPRWCGAGSPTTPTRPASPPAAQAAEDELAGRIAAARGRLPGGGAARRRAAADRRGLRGVRRGRAARRPRHRPGRGRARRLGRARDEVTADDIRVAARLALPHRRRRDPFDAPQLARKSWTGRLRRTARTRRPGDGEAGG